MQIERKYLSQEMPNKMKIGVSGCLNSCTESRLKDVGIIGTVEGWNVYAGGSGGAHPRIGDLIAEVTTEKEALAWQIVSLHTIKKNAQIERMGEFIDRIGLEAFKAAVLGDLEGAPAESKSEEPAVFLPGQGNDPEVEAPRLEVGSPITPDTIIRDIVETYPNVVPVLQSIGMGCLGCPSAQLSHYGKPQKFTVLMYTIQQRSQKQHEKELNMSAFLGHIHYWLYRKIQLLVERENLILEKNN